MDPFTADIIARTRRQEMADDAEAARAARAARDHTDEQRPAPRPKGGSLRARRLVAWPG
ncbi:MAG TPA: hypothetical protein VH969_29905 [Actinophytocola sp.]|jgi:hypothetical protein|uniref:hypothetical protein n=1 Tax=Actinophytocola sp. TaxID=1872138 RepID=UPI002F91EC83